MKETVLNRNVIKKIVFSRKLLEKIVLLILLYFCNFTYSDLDVGEDIIPEKCLMRDDIQFKTCCIFPPFFRGELARKCGAIMSLRYMSAKPNVTGIRRHTLTGCNFWRCLLKEYRLIVDDKYLDLENYFIHLDRWVEANPEFTGVLLNAKIHCKQLFKIGFPLEICTVFKFNGCIRNYITTDCPRLIDNEECRLVKEFYEECREYHI